MTKSRTFSLLALVLLLNFLLELLLLFVCPHGVLMLDACGILFGVLLWIHTVRELRAPDSSFLSLVFQVIVGRGQGLPELAAGLCFILPGLILDLLGCGLLVPAIRRSLLGSDAPASAPQQPHVPASQMTIDVKPVSVRDADTTD